MSSVIEVEVDLADYEDEISEYLNDGIKTDLKNYIKEMENNLYIYAECNRQFKSYEEIYRDLKAIIEEN